MPIPRTTATLPIRLAALVAMMLLCARGARAQAPAPVRVVAGVTEASVDVYYALDMGFFQRAGLDVDFQQVRSGQVEAAAVAAGRADIADSNVISLAQAIARNVPFVAIAPETVAAQRSSIRTIGTCCDAIAPHFLISVYFTSSDWANKNPAQASAIVEKWEHVSLAKGKYVHARTLDPALIQPLLDAGAKYKLFPRPVSVSEMLGKTP